MPAIPDLRFGDLFTPSWTESDACTRLANEPNLRPVLSYLDGGVPSDATVNFHTAELDLESKRVRVEVVDFTGREMEVCTFDRSRLSGQIESVADEAFEAFLDPIRESVNASDGFEVLQSKLYLMQLERKLPELKQHLVDLLWDRAPHAIEVLVDAGESELCISKGADSIVFVLPCPTDISRQKARDHYYVLLHDPASRDKFTLMAVGHSPQLPGIKKEDLAEVAEMVYLVFVLGGDSQAELGQRIDGLLRHMIPMYRFEVVQEYGDATLHSLGDGSFWSDVNCY
jgi:hypothetical protein